MSFGCNPNAPNGRVYLTHDPSIENMRFDVRPLKDRLPKTGRRVDARTYFGISETGWSNMPLKRKHRYNCKFYGCGHIDMKKLKLP